MFHVITWQWTFFFFIFFFSSFFFWKFLPQAVSGVLRRFQAPESSFDRLKAVATALMRFIWGAWRHFHLPWSNSNRLEALLVTYERFRSLTRARLSGAWGRLKKSMLYKPPSSSTSSPKIRASVALLMEFDIHQSPWNEHSGWFLPNSRVFP